MASAMLSVATTASTTASSARRTQRPSRRTRASAVLATKKGAAKDKGDSTPTPVTTETVFPGKDADQGAQHLRERNRIATPWAEQAAGLKARFGCSDADLAKHGDISSEEMAKAYTTMQVCREFENECGQAYMAGKIRGFMHLDNGQESIPALIADAIRNGDLKHSYYRDHTHAIASGVDPGAVMAELYGKDGGTCRGTGGSMHIYDPATNFQGGWALVAEQLPYAVGAARSIHMDRSLDYPGKQHKAHEFAKGVDDRITVVFVGEGGAQNGRMAECLNAAAKENLPILFLVIDNGRAINTFTQDVAANQAVYRMGEHYGVPGALVDGQSMEDTLKVGRTVIDHVRNKGPAILQVHTFRFNGHSPADPEHERNRKDEKRWARKDACPLKIFEASAAAARIDVNACKADAAGIVKAALEFAEASPDPPSNLARDLEYPDPRDFDGYEAREPTDGIAASESLTTRANPAHALDTVRAQIQKLRDQAADKGPKGGLSIGDAVNLAILEEMLRDPTTTIHAEDLQAGSSYNVPAHTQQAFGRIRACDEIIDEGHFLGKALGEAMNGYRPIVEMMNMNFGIYGMAELSSAGNTYATTGGQYKMPMTVIGAGGTAPNQSLGAEHSQPFHAYIMGIPGLKIMSAASPDAAYGLTKSAIRDNGPCVILLPVKAMKIKGPCATDVFYPLNKVRYLQRASDEALAAGKGVTVLTYLHGVKEAHSAIAEMGEAAAGVDLIELLSLKPVDMDTIRESLSRTHRLILLDESTRTGGVGATISARVSEECFDELDAPVMRLCMEDAPVPYATSIEKTVVKRASDLVEGLKAILG